MDWKETEPSKFIKSLTKAQLREFLCRSTYVNHTPSILSTMIISDLQLSYPSIFQQYPNLHIKTRVNKSPKYSNPPDIYTVIEFTNKQPIVNPVKGVHKPTPKHVYTPIGHITFHFICNQCGSNTNHGPFHAINDRSTRKAHKINVLGKQTNQCCQYALKLKDSLKQEFAFNEDMRELSNATLRVISSWFEAKHPHTLTKTLCNQTALDDIELYLNDIAAWKSTRGGGKRQRRTCKRKRRV
jgi:hypothetical protein